MSRMVGTVSRGIRAPIIREGDDLASIVTQSVLEETARQIGTQVFRAAIREAIAVREAEAAQQSIFTYAPKSKQAKDYDAFVEEFLRMRGAR